MSFSPLIADHARATEDRKGPSEGEPPFLRDNEEAEHEGSQRHRYSHVAEISDKAPDR
jgi:hypothetical protein